MAKALRGVPPQERIPREQVVDLLGEAARNAAAKRQQALEAQAAGYEARIAELEAEIDGLARMLCEGLGATAGQWSPPFGLTRTGQVRGYLQHRLGRGPEHRAVICDEIRDLCLRSGADPIGPATVDRAARDLGIRAGTDGRWRRPLSD